MNLETVYRKFIMESMNNNMIFYDWLHKEICIELRIFYVTRITWKLIAMLIPWIEFLVTTSIFCNDGILCDN